MENKPLWKWHEKKVCDSSMSGPEEWARFLEADCTITIGDLEHVEDEGADVWGDMTIKRYFERYIFGDVEEIACATVTIESLMINRFDRLWDLKVEDGMEIFIHSEEF